MRPPAPTGLLLAACVLLGSCAALEEPYGGPYSGRGGVARRAGPSEAAGLSEGPLELTVSEAILVALDNNRAFRVERFRMQAPGTYDELAAEFDPKLTGEFAAAEGTSVRSYGPIGPTELESSSASGQAAISKRLASGTELEIDVSSGRNWSDSGGDIESTRLGVTLAQPLLRGGRRRANLASIRQAQLDTRASEHEFRGLAEALVADVEKTYWDCYLAERKIEIYEESLELARKQLAETEERIRVGQLAAGIDLPAPKAEVSLRKEALSSAEGARDKARLRLARVVGAVAGRRGSDIVLLERPLVPAVDLGEDAKPHVERALEKRPDLKQAELALERGELEIVKTKNGLLPRLDLFLTYGKSGYADAFGNAVDELGGKAYDLAGGLSLEYVFGNRSARARHERALVARDEAEEALANMRELIEFDVRTALIEVKVRRAQVDATLETRRSFDDVLQAERHRLDAGKSTTFHVALAQRDLVASQITEVEARVNVLKALVDFYRAEGTLLERRGISLGP